jgi:HAD superfamily hydrolase (TIGR01509 family)
MGSRTAAAEPVARFRAVRRPVTAVLFDFAGTLFSPRPADDWVAAAATDCGISLAREDVDRLASEYLRVGLPGGPYPAEVPRHLERAYAERDFSGSSHRSAYVGLLSTVPAPAAGLAEALYAQVRRPHGWLPYRDAHGVVKTLQDSGVKVGVVSNVGFDLRPILRHHGFDGLAANCTLSFEHGVVKPDPAIFQTALEALEAAAEDTLMVGDHPTADAAAALLGCRTLLLPMSAPGAVHGLGEVLRLVTTGPQS